MVRVEIVYIGINGSILQEKFLLKIGSTVNDLLNEAKIKELLPHSQNLPVGIFSKLVALDRVLQDGDRVEIYRPLLFDPKEKRKQRAKNNPL